MYSGKGFMVTMIAAFGLAACGGGEDNGSAAGGGDKTVSSAKAEADKKLMNNENFKAMALPKSFPKDIIIPDSWTIMMASPMPGQTNGYMANAARQDDLANIVAEIQSILTSEGWTETANEKPLPAITVLRYEKDGRELEYNITESGDLTQQPHIISMKVWPKR